LHFVIRKEVTQNLESFISGFDIGPRIITSNDRIWLTSYTSCILVVSLHDVMHVFCS